MGNCLRLGISKIGLAWTKRKIKTSIKLKAISILILGTQAVGKTTIALRLWKYKRSLPDLNYVQTKGFNTYSVGRKNKSTINLYDLGGHPSIQELWDHYYADAHGVIFVVDVSDQATLTDAGLLFAKVLNDERIRGKPILLLANKQDLGGASEVELDSVMNLQEVVNTARCLTRLDESTATDLKNDKGIFEGFRWLVSHIENHYHELNDRVMHDILEEKNREKTRRVALKEQMNQTSDGPTDNNSTPTRDRPNSQKSLQSCKFAREESTIDLQKPANEITLPPVFSSRKNSLTFNDVTNYLIKSRPNSSIGNANNPFLVTRGVYTAPTVGRRSLPSLPSFHGSKARVSGSHFFSPSSNNPSQETKGQVFSKMFGDSRHNSETALVMPAPVSSASGCSHGMVTGGRLSPEGADSDEGIVNPAFENTTEESEKTQTGAGEEVWGSGGVLSAQNVHVLPNVAHVSPKIGTHAKRPLSSEKLKRLERTESSDTERTGEILMVTTLVQVHQDQRRQLSKERRGSTTSTQESVALSSLSSFKSEDTEGWKDEDDPQSRSQSRGTNRATPPPLPHVLPTAKVFKVMENSGNPSLPSIDKDKGRKRNLRSGLMKNKTAPLPPGTVMSHNIKSQSSSDVFTSGNLNKLSGTSTTNRNSNVALSNRRSRENSINNASVGGGMEKKRLKKSLEGFSEETNNSNNSQSGHAR